MLVVEHDEKGPVGRSRHGMEVNVKMDLKEMWFEDVDWIHLAQDREQ
jgi:hypothetical protein